MNSRTLESFRPAWLVCRATAFRYSIAYVFGQIDGGKDEGSNPMRSFYATDKHLRLFVFGAPEKWQAALYDLEQQQWIDKGDCIHESLREAKTDLQAKAATLLNRKLPDLDWH